MPDAKRLTPLRVYHSDILIETRSTPVLTVFYPNIPLQNSHCYDYMCEDMEANGSGIKAIQTIMYRHDYLLVVNG